MRGTSAALALAAACDGAGRGTGETGGPADIGAPEAIAAGPAATCVAGDGGVACWGDGAAEVRAVDGLAGAAALAVGDGFACALRADGGVACWGAGGRGQLGDGALEDRDAAASVAGLSSVRSLSAGEAHACATTASGEVRCWGAGDAHQLGDGAAQDRAEPVAVDVAGVLEVAAGRAHTCALRTDGSAWCWGDAAPAGQPEPWAVDDVVDLQDLCSGADHACGVDFWGEVLCWGDNAEGQLGAGDREPHALPVLVEGIGPAAAVRCGRAHTCALLEDGTVACWGADDRGQLGRGAPGSGPAPAPVAGLAGVSALALHLGDHACALTEAAEVLCWGAGDAGQLGPAADGDAAAPQPAW